MHLYVHEFENSGDNSIGEIRALLLANSLKDYLVRMDLKPKNLKIKKTEHGKPFFPEAEDVRFSISHSGRYWVCLFDSDNVGVDIEDYSDRNIPVDRIENISDRFFTVDEKEYIIQDRSAEEFGDEATDREVDVEMKKRFFRVWTAKEAYIKFTGNGISEGLKSFSVLDDSQELSFTEVPVDPQASLTFCSEKTGNLDELINV